MSRIVFNDGIEVGGSLRLKNSPTVTPGFNRGDLIRESLADFVIPWEAWKVHDNFRELIPSTPVADDLGLIGGTFATAVPTIQTYDLDTTTATLYARACLVMPIEYDAANQVRLRFKAGMLTNIADTTATLDVEAYLSDKEGLVSGADLCVTNALDINSLTLDDKTFTLTPTALVPGSLIDVRIAMAIDDGGTGDVVKGIISAASLLCDVRG